MENGVTVDGTAMAGLLLQTVIHTMENTDLTKDTAEAVTSGATAACTMVCSERTVVTDGERLPGLMEQYTKESSDQANAKAKGLTSLVMAEDTRVAGRMVVTMDMAFVSGKMVDVTRGNGSTEWHTAKALKPLRMVLFDTMASGSKTSLAYRVTKMVG